MNLRERVDAETGHGVDHGERPSPGAQPVTDPDLDPVLRVHQVAERLGASEDAVQRMCREGRIRATKIGGHWFVLTSNLARLSQPAGLDLREMARRLSVELGTVRRLCHQGDIPAEKIRGRWCISEQRWSELFR